MFRAVHRSSSGALTVYAASGLHTHVVTGRSQVWVGTQFPLRLDYGWSPHAYVNQRLQIQLELLMMSGVLLVTCWAFNEWWNNKFCYKVASCWLFLLNVFTLFHFLCTMSLRWPPPPWIQRRTRVENLSVTSQSVSSEMLKISSCIVCLSALKSTGWLQYTLLFK